MQQAAQHQAFVMTLSCQDRPGLVAAVTGRLAEIGGNIREAQQYNAVDTQRFFMRIGFDCPGLSPHEITERFADITANFVYARLGALAPADRPMQSGRCSTA